MPIRARTRYPGDIDPALGQSIPMHFLPAWVSGRFYEACCPGIASAPTTAGLAGTSLLSSPFVVPAPITVTSIGVEITSAATAGNTMRLAIYNSDSLTGWPDKLLLDSGNIVIDATGFQSASISLILPAGLYWATHGATATATYRAYNTPTLVQFLALSEISNPALTYGTCIFWGNLGLVYASKGMPQRLPVISNNSNSISIGNFIVPRILLGV